MPEKLTPSDIATVLRRLRKGDKALLDKKKALADLGYGSEKNVEEELRKANNYRGARGLPPLDINSKNYKSQRDTSKFLVTKPDTSVIDAFEKGGSASYSYSQSDSSDRGQLNLPLEPSTEEVDSLVSGYLKGDVSTPEEILGHELTHSMNRSEFPFYSKLGRGIPREDQLDPSVEGSTLSNVKKYDPKIDEYVAERVLTPASEVNREDRITYPELSPNEFAPPLAAMTRLEYLKTGERIDTPEKFDKKIAEYDAMSSEEKLAFKKKLPTEVSRFYQYLDTVSDPQAEDIYLWGPEDDETPSVRNAKTNTVYHSNRMSHKLRYAGIDIKDYDDMTTPQRVAFKKQLRDRKLRNTIRAADYLDSYDKYLKRNLKDNFTKQYGLKGGEKSPVKVEGKDRRKRFLDISREMVPSLVEKEDSFEEAVNRRMS